MLKDVFEQLESEPSFALDLMTLLSFEDRQAIEYFKNSFSLFTAAETLNQALNCLNILLRRTYNINSEASPIITHKSFTTLVHMLLTKFSDLCELNESKFFWTLQDTIIRLLLVYKFADFPRECLLDTFNTLNNVSKLYLVSKVFFDKAFQLATRFNALKKIEKNEVQMACYFGLLGTCLLAKEGRTVVQSEISK